MDWAAQPQKMADAVGVVTPGTETIPAPVTQAEIVDVHEPTEDDTASADGKTVSNIGKDASNGDGLFPDAAEIAEIHAEEQKDAHG